MTALISTLSPNAAYASKDNIAYPGTQTQATAAEASAQARYRDVDPIDVQTTVSAGAVTVSN